MKKLDELDDEVIKKIVTDYKSPSSVITVAAIIKKYDLDIKPTQIAQRLPTQEIDEQCPYCQKNLVVKMINRTELSDPFCLVCGHAKHDNGTWAYKNKECDCLNCKARRENEIKNKQEQIRTVYSNDINAVDLYQLTLKDQYYLFSVLYFTGGITHEVVLDKYYNSFPASIRELKSKGIISISPKSPIEAFTEIDFPYNYYPSKVFYDINVTFSKKELNDIKNGLINEKINATPEEKYELFQEIMHKDIITRFGEMMHERGLDLEILVNAEDELKKLYTKLSYGQIISLCFSVARYYLDNTQTGRIYKSTVKKSALKTVATFYRNSIDKEWKINNSEVSYAGKELKFFIEEVLHKDIRILREVITINDM